jgi:hypothetical protein
LEPKTRTLEDAVVEQVLEGQPRAQEWREWKQALQLRLDSLLRERAAPGPMADLVRLDETIAETRDQIQALSTEQVITQFVEDAARFSLLAQARPLEDDEDQEDW